ncbi:YgfZ/GcvT domain-containing protein [Rariglobus hedericola]|uniref:Folate-binding protein n=1 Tax=Rariglobus hedericola TaxID=2597822 RepID=A0A556QGK7_9BACT|nr:folate-binding protein [Rariglobus hedericola]TSJ75766.1 folate-binding protein [Rariglobus hedericola]
MDKMSQIFDPSITWKSSNWPTACLHVTGEDALSFLQGQFTQELRSPIPLAAAYGLWLNQKGKVLADSFVLRETADSVWIISFSSSAAVISERLEAYIIADDVVITDVSADWHSVAVGGPEAEAWLMQVAGAVPAAGEFVRATGGGLVFCGRRDGGTSFEWLLPSTVGISAGLVEVSADDLERMRIATGLPRVPQDIGSGDLPNEGGLDAVGISYTKGCYLGQEVMARLKAMGTVRRRLVRVRAEGRGVPAVPCALLQGEKRVGELRSAVADGSGGFIGLAMVTKLGLDPAQPLAPEPGDAFIELIDTP